MARSRGASVEREERVEEVGETVSSTRASLLVELLVEPSDDPVEGLGQTNESLAGVLGDGERVLDGRSTGTLVVHVLASRRLRDDLVELSVIDQPGELGDEVLLAAAALREEGVSRGGRRLISLADSQAG